MNPKYITDLGNGKAVFSANDGTHGAELWVTNGTAAGTSLVKDIFYTLSFRIRVRIRRTSQRLATARRCSLPMTTHMADYTWLLSCG